MNTTKQIEPQAMEGFEFPQFSSTTSKLVAELNGDHAEVSTIVQLIECEPTVAAKVLKLADSPIYGVNRSVTTIGHAVVLLG